MGGRRARGLMAQRTPLYDRHRALGARLVDFAGWEMPVSYGGALEEHRAVRQRCGLFDVSHMGEVEVRGRGAAAWCDSVLVNDVARLADGGGQYSMLCDDTGGVVDDVIVYRLAPERFLIVVNASTTPGDLDWLRAHARPDVDREVTAGSQNYSPIAASNEVITNPVAREFLPLFDDAISPIDWLWEPEITAEIDSQVQALVKGATDAAAAGRAVQAVASDLRKSGRSYYR